MPSGLVLAGGGVAGIAWETGVLRGIEEVDPALAASLVAADVVVGTSAGSTVAAQIASGATLADLYAAQQAQASEELAVPVDMGTLLDRLTSAADGSRSPEDLRRRIGAMATATRTVDEADRLAVIAGRLPTSEWPDRDVRIVAVDVGSGAVVVFDRHAGITLVDAVAASCAVPGVWPPVTIAGRRYMDGGVRSSANADLAAGCDPVVVLSPASPDAPSLGSSTLGDEVASLAPADVAVVSADSASVAAFGLNPLDPATRPSSAAAGRAQGRREAARLAAVWS